MRTLIPRSTVHWERLQALTTLPTESDDDEPKEIVDWLARLTLLYGVPFAYLVGDYRMLPPESLRWGFLDQNWLDRATDGALSVGRTDTVSSLVDQALFQRIAAPVARARGRVRATLRGDPLPDSVTIDATATVMLLRSAVVGGYPGLEVRGYDAAGNDLDLLRMDRLAPDVLLIVFPVLPARVDLAEPPEGLHFGVRGTATTPTTLLRSLQPATLGHQVTEGGVAVQVDLALRAGSTGVIDVAASAAALRIALEAHDGRPPNTPLAPAEFAIEMVRAAGLQSFVPNPSERELP